MKKFSFFSTFFVFLGVLTCISCAYLFSNIIISANIFSLTSAVGVETQKFYAISMKSGSTDEDFSQILSTLKAQNGAGVLLEKDEKLFAIASAYENKADAEKVQKSLSSQSETVEIVEIVVESQKIEGSFSSEEKSILSDCLKSRYEIFRALYDVSISLDTEIFDLKKAKLECNNIFSKHIERKANLESLFKDSSTQLLALKKQMQTFYDLLSNLIAENFDQQNQTFSSLIKQTYVNILLN